MTTFRHRSCVMSGGLSILISLFLLMGLTSNIGGTEKKKIVLATCNWEPFMGENMFKGGVLAEITTAAFQRMGYAAKVEFVPWKRAVELAKIGEYDGLMAAYYNSERAQTYKLTDAINYEEIGFFRKKGSTITYKTLEDLRPYIIGIGRGGQYGDEFEAATYLKKEEVKNDDQNICKLMAGRIHLLISSKVRILDLLNTKYPEWRGELEFVEPALMKIGLHNMISRAIPNYETIAADFNLGLKKITDDGTIAKLMKAHGF
ncbi:amino acid ABC transporter substrate-binding protein [Candidatus Magnetomorum sp. HK-1]|nr:amino acid ABC transporter substrate-binding protein [Candidatus Magnetomorum sp. HK-1]